jgi:hypothetical protein
MMTTAPPPLLPRDLACAWEETPPPPNNSRRRLVACVAASIALGVATLLGGVGVFTEGGGGSSRAGKGFPGSSMAKKFIGSGNRSSATATGSGNRSQQQPPAVEAVSFADPNTDHDNGVNASPWYVPNLCRRNQIIEGRWVPVHLKRPPYYPPSNNTSCGGAKVLYSPKGYDTYRYVPNDSAMVGGSSNSTNSSNQSACHFTPWNKDMFCEVAKYATILIVGDSLSWEHYTSLIHLLGIRATHMYSRMSKDFDTNIGHAVCDGLARIVYRRDDSLTRIRHALLENLTHIPQVLVLNRGAHYVEDDQYLVELNSTLDVVEEWLGRCDQLQIKCHFFWRTTVPGHINCRTFKHPVNDKATMEAHIANLSLYSPKELAFHWYDFQHQNLLAEAELLKRRTIRNRILDGYHINVLRPDHHSDCLHSCCPGKMDVYPQLMLHYLRGDRSVEDVQRLHTVFDENRWNVNVTTEYIFCPSCQRALSGSETPYV